MLGCFSFHLRMVEGCGDPNPTSIRITRAARNIYRSEEIARADMEANCRFVYKNSTNPDYLNIDIETIIAEAVDNKSMCDNAS